MKWRTPYWIKKRIKSIIYRGGELHCPICERDVPFFSPYDCIWPERPNEICPVCSSFSRHRFLWQCMERTGVVRAGAVVLHFAPNDCLTERIRKSGMICVTTDLVMRGVDVQADICRLPMEDRTYDVVVCSMVLEHIPDDIMAMKEVLRVMKNGGSAFFVVPLREGVTLEDASITEPKRREKAFGQHDHVRFYGMDIADRFKWAGFMVRIRRVRDEFDELMMKKYALGSGEGDTVFVCSKGLSGCPAANEDVYRLGLGTVGGAGV